MFQGLRASFPDEYARFENSQATPNAVTVLYRDRGTFKGEPFKGVIPPTNKKMDVAVQVTCYFNKEGLIYKEYAWFDDASFQKVLS